MRLRARQRLLGSGPCGWVFIAAECITGRVGAGIQAWAQLWAIAAVRSLGEVVVWSRDGQHRAAFARRAREEFNINAREAASAQEAVRGRDIVVLATSSARPVIDPAWIAPGCHVKTLGPKQQGRAEFDAALAERADVLVTDSLAQARAAAGEHSREARRRRGAQCSAAPGLRLRANLYP